jgi:hypothetical protein
LILPIIRDISIHEVSAFVRPSNARKAADSTSVFTPDLFDIRFRVTRKVEAAISHSESMSQLWAQAPSNAAFESTPSASSAPHGNDSDAPVASTSLSGVLRAALPLASTLTSIIAPLGLWSTAATSTNSGTLTGPNPGKDDGADKDIASVTVAAPATNSQTTAPSATATAAVPSIPSTVRPSGSEYSDFVTIQEPKPLPAAEPMFRPVSSNDLTGSAEMRSPPRSEVKVANARESTRMDINAAALVTTEPAPAVAAPAGDRIAERLAALRKNKK